ncbi:diaminopimelate decarboxylase [Paracrocinitomix mangrovi]|uniref:diaminopimelate decarboxylase n=1 Tax=Paracrocinitomix mangrovi TaxID=2862509 RepID=UPI001C8D620C|nr:diaminopimelate decarboxylase [Paracrocinitomix mangrovi]UKN01411.1 diaminopimelate decarboxylase [Paracrocinitomix mangrovi]
MTQTPYYFYDLDLLNETLSCLESNIKGTNFKVHYAVKANNNRDILETISKKGLGADCVSGGEIRWSLESGFSPSEIVFAGVGKTDEEILYALENEVGMIHCESLQEILVINELAERLNTYATIALRLNPNVNPLTHEKISTGLKENKFGLTSLEFEELIQLYPSLNNVRIVGLHFHIGSQIHDMSVYVELCDRINELVPLFEEHIGEFTYLNVGGGLGIDYFEPDENPIPEFKEYFEVFKEALTIDPSIPVHFELGRSIVGQCGSLHTKVLYVKRSEEKNFAVLDAGMTELLRPALYNAYHKIERLDNVTSGEELHYDIVGPICESSDCFGRDILLPELKRGDIITIRSCGAYAESMSLNYNGRDKVPSYVHSSSELVMREKC